MTTSTSIPTLTVAEQDRTPAILIHLSPLLGYVLPSFGHLLGPALAWLAYRDRSYVLDDQGKEALNFQISLTIYSVVLSAIVGVLFVLGFFGGFAAGLLGMAGSAGSGDPAPMFAGIFGGILGLFGPFAAFFALMIPLTLLFSLFPLVVMLLAVARVSSGQTYRYPLTIRFLR